MFRSSSACVQCETEKPDTGRLLRCLHVLCEGCLKDSVNPQTASIHCVLCRKETKFTDGGAAAGSPRRPAWQTLPPSAGTLYTANTFTEGGSNPLSDDVQAKCPAHAGQVFSLYCETCCALVCGICCAAHMRDGHRMVPATDVVQKQRQEILRAVKEISSVPGLSDLAGLEDRLTDLSAAVDQVDEQATDASKKVETFYDNLIKALEKDKQRVKDEIDQIRWKKRIHLESEQSRLNSKRQTIDTIQVLGDRLAEGCSDSSSRDTVSTMDQHVLSLHSSILDATSGMTSEDLDTPMIHITGKLGVAIDDEAVENAIKTVKSQTTVFSTRVDVERMVPCMLKETSTPEADMEILQFPLQGFDNRPLDVDTVPDDVRVSVIHPDDHVQEMQLTVGRSDNGKPVCETEAFQPVDGGCPVHVSSAEKKMVTWYVLYDVKEFSRDLRSTSLSLSEDSCTVTATNTDCATAVGTNGYSSSRACWLFKTNWEDHHNIFMGVAKLKDRVTVREAETCNAVQGWWWCDDHCQQHAHDKSSDLVLPRKDCEVCLTIDVDSQRIEVLFEGMERVKILSLPSDHASGEGKWYPYFRLNNTGESITIYDK